MPPAFAQQSPAEVIRGVRFDQRLNAAVPLGLQFRDEEGRTVTLAQAAAGKPIVLSLVFYDCPMLCNLILNGQLKAMRAMNFSAGEEFTAITVSFDTREGHELAAKKKDLYARPYGRKRAAEGWRFLTGDEQNVRALTSAVGFRYIYDENTKQFAHASGLVVLTPEGKVSRYLYGIEYSARDLRLALVEASAGRIGSAVDAVLLFCYHYDPATGKYSLAILNVVRAAGTLTFLLLAGFVITMLRRERRGTLHPRHV
jgi:protein SCO1/2